MTSSNIFLTDFTPELTPKRLISLTIFKELLAFSNRLSSGVSSTVASGEETFFSIEDIRGKFFRQRYEKNFFYLKYSCTFAKNFPLKKLILFLCLLCGISSCGIYNFTGGSTGNAKTFQVNFFQNRAPLIEPGMDREFTFYLQDLINNQTNLSLTNSNGDLVYEGEITNFTVAPMAATADQRAAQNRLTVTVNVRFTNNKEEDKDFEKQFSHYYDFPANAQLSSVKSAAFEAIFERIGQDIFNASLANW